MNINKYVQSSVDCETATTTAMLFFFRKFRRLFGSIYAIIMIKLTFKLPGASVVENLRLQPQFYTLTSGPD